MTIAIKTTAVFLRPFQLPSFNETLPPGEYEIETQVGNFFVIDHSVVVDVAGRPDALERNAAIEFQRNEERYRFLKWGGQAFGNLRIEGATFLFEAVSFGDLVFQFY